MNDVNWHIKPDTIEKYLAICKAAVNDEAIYKEFRNHQDYLAVLEHTSEQIGQNCYEQILVTNKWLFFIDKIYNDRIGNPRCFKLGKFYCPASIMQYVWQVSNILINVGALHDFKICEIGGGYGGLCRIINELFNLTCYDIIDLPEVIDLQKKYLADHQTHADYFTPDNYPKEKKYDLVISNYALSEVAEPLQSAYMNEVVSMAKHGYLTINREITIPGWLHDKAKLLPDIKGESEENFIIIW